MDSASGCGRPAIACVSPGKAVLCGVDHIEGHALGRLDMFYMALWDATNKVPPTRKARSSGSITVPVKGSIRVIVIRKPARFNACVKVNAVYSDTCPGSATPNHFSPRT